MNDNNHDDESTAAIAHAIEREVDDLPLASQLSPGVLRRLDTMRGQAVEVTIPAKIMYGSDDNLTVIEPVIGKAFLARVNVSDEQRRRLGVPQPDDAA